MFNLDDILVSPTPRAALQEAGASLEDKLHTSTTSVNIGPIPISTGTTYTRAHIWTLPVSTGLEAAFVRESFKHMIIKLFKSELQVGDLVFDEAVYISTETPEATKAFLKDDVVIGALLSLISAGGDLAIEGQTVTIRASDNVDDGVTPNERDEAVIVAHLMAFEGGDVSE